MKLELSGITVRFGNGRDTLTAVDQVDLDIPVGGTIGLVGESGSGKSTVARAIVGLAPIVGGRLLVDGIDRTDERARAGMDYRRRVQMIFQDPSASLNPRMTVGEAINEALMMRVNLPKSARPVEALKILDLMGLPSSTMERYPHQFSGGQRQRIAIARALAVGPELLICDEVTSALDVSVQATILNLLKRLQRDLGLSLLFISHDLSMVHYMSDVVAVMYLGRIVESAATDALFGSPCHPYTRALMASIPRIGVSRAPPLAGDIPDPRHMPRGCPFHTRCPEGPTVRPERNICLEQNPAATASRYAHGAACHFGRLK